TDADPDVDEGPVAGPIGRGRHGFSSRRVWVWPAEMNWRSRLACHSRSAPQAASQVAAQSASSDDAHPAAALVAAQAASLAAALAAAQAAPSAASLTAAQAAFHASSPAWSLLPSLAAHHAPR